MNPSATLPSAQDAANQLAGFQAPDSGTLLSQAQSKYGIPDLQKKVSDLRGLTGNLTNAIAAVDPSVTGRTAGTFTTEAQRGALVNRERAPIVQQLGTTNDSLNLANSDFNTASGNAKDEASAQAADNSRKYDQLLQTYNIASAREAASAQAKAQQEASAREQANADRQYQLQAQASKSKGSAKTPSPQETQKVDSAALGQKLKTVTGSDGYVSPDSYAQAKSSWVQAGYSSKDFDTVFSNFRNPKNKNYKVG